MASQQSGGKITGLLALTMEATVATDVGDWVHVSGDYQVILADGTKPVLGRVSVSNKKSTSTATAFTSGVAKVPGDVTVEARGISVETVVAGAAFAAGVEVGIAADGTIQAMGVGAGLMAIGISLMAATGAGDDVDVLITAAA